MPVETVACLGSSTTAGKGQAFNWIQALEKRPQNKHYRFVNFGVGGDLAYNALERLSSVAACHPDKVVILIGGNDILASVFKNARRFFISWKRLPKDPSPEWFRENLQAIVRGLKEKTSAKIALLSLPQVGENDLGPPLHAANSATDRVQQQLNTLFHRYGEIIRDLARQENVRYIPFYELLNEQIAKSPGRTFPAFRLLPLYLDTFRYFVLRRSGDEIAKMNGWRFHVDGVHLNSRGGMILADLVQEFLND